MGSSVTLRPPWWAWVLWLPIAGCWVFFSVAFAQELQFGNPGSAAVAAGLAILFFVPTWRIATWRIRVTPSFIEVGSLPRRRRLEAHEIARVARLDGRHDWNVVPSNGRRVMVVRARGRRRAERLEPALEPWLVKDRGHPAHGVAPILVRSKHPLLWFSVALGGPMSAGLVAGTIAMAVQGEWALVSWMAPLALLLSYTLWLSATQSVRIGVRGIRWRHWGIRHRVKWGDVQAILPHAGAARAGVWTRGRKEPYGIDFMLYSKRQRQRIMRALEAWAAARGVDHVVPETRRVLAHPVGVAVALVSLAGLVIVGVGALATDDLHGVFKAGLYLAVLFPFYLILLSKSHARIEGGALITHNTLGRPVVTPLGRITALRWQEGPAPPTLPEPEVNLGLMVADWATTGIRPMSLVVEAGAKRVIIHTGIQRSGTATAFAITLARQARFMGAKLRWDESAARLQEWVSKPSRRRFKAKSS